jgi:hypothetical protein
MLLFILNPPTLGIAAPRPQLPEVPQLPEIPEPDPVVDTDTSLDLQFPDIADVSTCKH